ncbi:MAG: thioredoxin-like domain-containing protein [Gilvibacter sp.]
MKRAPLHIKLLIPLIAIVLGSCADLKVKEELTYFGGEIINPKLPYVLLSKNSKVIDTIALDDNNFFMYQIKDLESGLYSFRHREYQLLYIEPGDSIMLRVNTFEFDESLAFTGKGSVKNNFLINMFLHNERENNKMPSFYQLNPEEFEKALDSMSDARSEIFAHFSKKMNPSEGFIEVAQAGIDYDYYSKKELYPFAHYGSNHLQNMENLPADFYDFRKDIDYGNNNLATYYPYYQYLKMHLDNLTYSTYMKRAKFNRKSHLHTTTKIHLIDSLITHQELKNNLIYLAAHRFILHAKDTKNNEEMLGIFASKNNNEKQLTSLKKLISYCDNMMPGKPLPNQMVVTSENTIKDLQSMIKRPTILFFWSTQSSSHYKRIHNRAAELKAKFPEYDFIGISVDENHENWLNAIAAKGYNPEKEFRFNDVRKAEEQLVLNSANKAIITDKHGNIVLNNTNLYLSNFESQLVGLLNQ